MATRRGASDDARLIRALKYQRCPGVTLKDVRARFGVTPSALRAARARLAEQARWTAEDLVLSGLRDGRWASPESLIGWIDYLDHARWSEDELVAVLERLKARGMVDGPEELGWRLIGEWP